MAKHYAGIGTRNPTDQGRVICTRAARYLAKKGWTLNTGACTGVDQIFANAALAEGGTVNLHLPWPRYENQWVQLVQRIHGDRVVIVDNDVHYDVGVESVYHYHPQGAHLNPKAMPFHVRNFFILHPYSPEVPVNFVMALPSPQGGGTMQGVRIAQGEKIPLLRVDQLDEKEVKSKIMELTR